MCEPEVLILPMKHLLLKYLHQVLTRLVWKCSWSEKFEDLPKGQSEAVSRRKTDKTVAKNKKAKEQTMVYLQYTAQKTTD